MNLKKMWKRFWNLNVHNHEGFTLVELIIVIAILAILSAVAVAGYSAYIKKANEGADKATLAQLNNAFALACANNGQDHFDRKDNPEVTLTEGKVTELGFNPADETNAKIKADFMESVRDLKFNNITELLYNKDLGQFEEGLTVNGVTISKADVEKILGTTWLEQMGSSELLDMVFDTADIVSVVYGDMLGTVGSSDVFKNTAAAALGMTRAEFDTYYTNLVDEKMKEHGWDQEDLFDQEDIYLPQARNEVDAELAILVAAKNAESVDIMDILTSGGGNGVKDQIKSELGTNPTEGLSQAALAYGMYHAWIYSRSDLTPEQKEELSSPSRAMNDLDNTDFQTWLTANPQAQADLQGLIAALGAISGQDGDVAQDIVENGNDSDALKEALEALLGK